MRRRSFLAGASASLVAPALASDMIVDARALSGGRFVSGETEYLLTDILAPPLYALDASQPAYFKESRAALQAALTAGCVVRDALGPTRWGVRRVIAQAQDTGVSVQEVMVRAGAVRVAPQTENHEFISRLLLLEEEARAASEGLWTLEPYHHFRAENAEGAVGGFSIVEGTVKKAGLSGSRFYLNFGDDFRNDFTASTTGRLYRRWKKTDLDLETLEGAHIRLRGWVEAINGPSIDLTHPLQIESLP